MSHQKKSRGVALLLLSVSALVLSACGDSRVAGKAQEHQDAAAAMQQGVALINSADKVKPGSGRASAEELVAEHAIHWSHSFFFPAEVLDGKIGWQAMYMAHAKLKKLASNESVVTQIRKCHENTTEGRLIAAGYNFENSTLMGNYNERVISHRKDKGRYLDIDLLLYFISLVEKHRKTLTTEQFEAVSDEFWQWCIALPNTHWSGRYQDNPISL